MKRVFLTVIFMAIMVMANAQQGNVVVKADPRVDSLIAMHAAHNQAYPFVEGYRIQVFKDSGNDALDAARDIMDQFHEDFPDIPAYLSFQEPYYRVRVGDFRTRLEALEQLENIKRKFRNVWVIKDYIRFSEEQINQN
ncbi:MAG: hypothetical protein DRJ09_06245 [Bacteroidetes bacterium]|nr:MAG: hypothetical protein DRJ09_06245 [Bacteroidota bacterium]